MDKNTFIQLLQSYYIQGLSMWVAEKLLIPYCKEKKNIEDKETKMFIIAAYSAGILSTIIEKVIDYYELKFTISKVYSDETKHQLIKIF